MVIIIVMIVIIIIIVVGWTQFKKLAAKPSGGGATSAALTSGGGATSAALTSGGGAAAAASENLTTKPTTKPLPPPPTLPPPPPPPSPPEAIIIKKETNVPFTFKVGETIEIATKGEYTGTNASFAINLLPDDRSARVMQLGNQLYKKMVSFNCKDNGKWLSGGSCGVDIPNKHVWNSNVNVIKVKNTSTSFEVSINGTHVYSFQKRVLKPVTGIYYGTGAGNPPTVEVVKYPS